mgnify:CR=1 FL=1
MPVEAAEAAEVAAVAAGCSALAITGSFEVLKAERIAS